MDRASAFCCNTASGPDPHPRGVSAIRTGVALPAPYPGAGLQFDPRWKLAAFAAAGAAAALARTPAGAALSLAGALLLAALAHLPARWFLARLAAALPFLALFALPLPFLVAGQGPTWNWGPLTVSARGAAAAVLILCKGAALVTLTVVLLATAPPDALLKAARSLRVPGLVVQLGLLTYRYLFVLADEFGRLRVALRVRGFRNRPTRHGYRTLGQVAGTLLVRGHDRAERVAQAMRCRGFDGRYRSLAAFRAGPADVLAAGLIAASAAGVAALDWLWS